MASVPLGGSSPPRARWRSARRENDGADVTGDETLGEESMHLPGVLAAGIRAAPSFIPSPGISTYTPSPDAGSGALEKSSLLKIGRPFGEVQGGAAAMIRSLKRARPCRGSRLRSVRWGLQSPLQTAPDDGRLPAPRSSS